MKKVYVLITSILVFMSCLTKKEDVISPINKKAINYNSEMAHDYYSHYLDVVKHSDGYRPPISARSLAIIGLTIYESMSPSFTKYNSIQNQIPDLILPKIETSKTYHWGVVANTAYKCAIVYNLQTMTQEDFEKNESFENKYNAKFINECDTATFNRSQKYAKDVCFAVYQYSLKDGQGAAFRNNKPKDYIAPKGEGLWKSTAPDFLNALTPTWGKVRTILVPTNENEYELPLAFSKDENSAFVKQVREVFTAVNNTTVDSKWVAEFWSDDLNNYTVDAAGRWVGIASNYMYENKVDLETAIYIYAKLGIGLHDAAVACWKEKYKFNVLRPVSYINDNIDPNWRSILRDPTKPEGKQIGVTPQHPSYPSGHSVFGALAAEIMIKTFGDKIKFTDRTHEKETYFDGRPRSFTSFTSMAEENAYSRIPLGVHYRMDCVEGLKLGKKVGQRINSISWETLQ
jgi:membrane-associated phospholipid phosphatase